ncbi:MAG: tRNA lysidine(34) synthetase TilS [Bacteroidaceae bacterium]|nr:tRNA lysidine(34) synthetase TilS [Bacteroidaceae bacterium]MBQ4039227.1 tRNA lysidine(34) synthetase TilS [Bacteroidaceae bacterium]
MHRKVRRYIEKRQLLDDDAKILVALSGGADSVALLRILTRLGYHCTAAHCNFHLRGEESLRDEEFARALCTKLGIRLAVAQFDTATYAKEKKISIEMAARELRYSFFEETAVAEGATAIAVAHHRDDVAETILLNLIRGTGIRGLHGIQPKNGNIIRPLLCLDRAEITAYLESIGQEYVTDSSNLATDYTRNKIRLEILPLLRTINPSITHTLAETAERISEAEKAYDRAIADGKRRILDNNCINIAGLLDEPSPTALLHEILTPLGFNGQQSTDIIEHIGGGSGKEYKSPTHTLTRDREKLIVTTNNDTPQAEILLTDNDTYATPHGTLTIGLNTYDGTIDKNRSVATLDNSRLEKPLTLRPVQRGDRFRPLGMKGSKLVSDYLTDRKKTLPEKQRQLAVVDRNNNIVWLVGERPAAPYAVTPQTTEVLILKWEEHI